MPCLCGAVAISRILSRGGARPAPAAHAPANRCISQHSQLPRGVLAAPFGMQAVASLVGVRPPPPPRGVREWGWGALLSQYSVCPFVSARAAHYSCGLVDATEARQCIVRLPLRLHVYM